MADVGMLQGLDPDVVAYLKEINANPGMLDAVDIRRSAQDRRRQQEDDARRAQALAAGAQGWRRLVHIMKGGQPSRELNWEPPPMPPAVPSNQNDILRSRVNGAPVFNPNPSITPFGRGPRG